MPLPSRSSTRPAPRHAPSVNLAPRPASALRVLPLLAASLLVACGGDSGGSAAGGQPTIEFFTATPPTVTTGQSSLLAWSVSGATSLSIDHGVGTVTGTTRIVNPAATATYTLTATNASGSATATATVTVGLVAIPWLSLLAGNVVTPGSVDGTGPAARFFDPVGVAVDASGNVFVADTGNHTIRKIAPGGDVSTLAGTARQAGWTDGTGAAARFDTPSGIAVDAAGNLFVADTGNHTIRKVTQAGVVTTIAGTVGLAGAIDGNGVVARFNRPRGIAADASGNLFVADTGNHTIRKISAAIVVTTIAGSAGLAGAVDGAGAAARFNAPEGIGVLPNGLWVVVADRYNHTIRHVSSGGFTTTAAGLAGSPGHADGTTTAARFNLPRGVAVDSSANVYVTDSGNYTIRKITGAGVVTTPVGQAGSPGFTPGGLPGQLGGVLGVAVSGTSLFAVSGYGVVQVSNRP